MSRLEKIPVPCIATFLSFLTLGNVYGGLGFVWLRYLIMALGTIFIICYILKIAMFSGTCMKEYDMTIPASLYGAFSMVLMVLGSFYYEIGLPFGKIIWFIASAFHSERSSGLSLWRSIVSTSSCLRSSTHSEK